MLKDKSWLWRGSWEEIESPIRAFLLAPLCALLPIAPFILIPAIGGAASFEQVFFIGFFVLIISYATTLIIGLPWFLFLSKIGFAGLIPIMAASLVPLVGMQVMSRSGSSALSYLYFLICGIAVSSAFWKLARTPYDGPRQDWEERIQKLVDGLTRRKAHP